MDTGDAPAYINGLYILIYFDWLYLTKYIDKADARVAPAYINGHIHWKIYFDWLYLTKYIDKADARDAPAYINGLIPEKKIFCLVIFKVDAGDAPAYMGIYLRRYFLPGNLLQNISIKLILEMHLHIWAYTREDIFRLVMLDKYKYTHKSLKWIMEMQPHIYMSINLGVSC